MGKITLCMLTWFWSIFLVAHDKRSVSAVFLARELEISYPTAWFMLHKIRKAMGDRDAHYQLAGLVELDDAFSGAPTDGGKRGRGTDQTQVLVGVSLNKQGATQYVKMQVIPDVKGKTLVEFAKQHIEPGSTAKAFIGGTFHGLDSKHLQSYS